MLEIADLVADPRVTSVSTCPLEHPFGHVDGEHLGGTMLDRPAAEGTEAAAEIHDARTVKVGQQGPHRRPLRCTVEPVPRAANAEYGPKNSGESYRFCGTHSNVATSMHVLRDVAPLGGNRSPENLVTAAQTWCATIPEMVDERISSACCGRSQPMWRPGTRPRTRRGRASRCRWTCVPASPYDASSGGPSGEPPSARIRRAPRS